MKNSNDIARDLVQRLEGLRLEAYDDGHGTWTIGYGHTRGVKPGQTCTQKEALEWLGLDLFDAWQAIDRHIGSALRYLSARQVAALQSVLFNTGPKPLHRGKPLRLAFDLRIDTFLTSARIRECPSATLVERLGLGKRRWIESTLYDLVRAIKSLNSHYIDRDWPAYSLQSMIWLAGFDPGRIDGVIGPKTKAAIGAFQRSRKLIDSRWIDPDTWLQLRDVLTELYGDVPPLGSKT